MGKIADIADALISGDEEALAVIDDIIMETPINVRFLKRRTLGRFTKKAQSNRHFRGTKNGWVWTYRKDRTYLNKMHEAQEAKCGMWESDNTIEPYKFRKKK